MSETAPQATGPRVVVFLHGHGDRPEDSFRVAAPFMPAGTELVTPAGPCEVGDGTLAWFAAEPDGGPDPVQLAEALDAVSAVVDTACATFGTAPDRVAVGGFSQGGAVALAWALRAGSLGRGSTPRVAGVFCVAGWLPDADGLELDLAHPVPVPFLIAHGDDDEKVPLPMGRSVVRVLERSDWSVTFAGGEHGHEVVPFGEALHTWLAALG